MVKDSSSESISLPSQQCTSTDNDSNHLPKNSKILTNEDIDNCVDLWISYTLSFSNATREELSHHSDQFTRHQWEKVYDSAETWWQFIIRASEKDMPDIVFSNLAAGPLEDFLVYYGRDYADQIISLAKTHSKFKDLLGGVWKNRIDDELWNKITEIRGEPW